MPSTVGGFGKSFKLMMSQNIAGFMDTNHALSRFAIVLYRSILSLFACMDYINGGQWSDLDIYTGKYPT